MLNPFYSNLCKFLLFCESAASESVLRKAAVLCIIADSNASASENSTNQEVRNGFGFG